MKKRLLALLLTISLCVTMTVPAFAAGSDTSSIAAGAQVSDAEETDPGEEESAPDEGGTGDEGEEPDPSETETPGEGEGGEEGEEPDPSETETPGEGEEGEEPDPSETENPDEDEEEPKPELETTVHVDYINGRGNGTFDPDDSLTRAEAATMIASLMATEEYGSYETTFFDVAEGSWYEESIMLLASWGILQGYEDGSFRPDSPITRAEFVTVLGRFYTLEDGTNIFPDVDEEHWAYAYIISAAEKGWVHGYPDGTFGPSKNITRAEAVTVINAMLGRSADAEETAALIAEMGVCIFVDVSSEAWYYYDVMEASIPHDYTISENEVEVWTDLTYKSCGFSTGWNKVGSYKYYVNENGQFEAYPSGIQVIDDVTCYVDDQGRIPLNAAGKYIIDGIAYYVNNQGEIPLNAAGVYSGVSAVYYVDDQGQIPRDAAGIYYVGDIAYYVNSQGEIPQNAAGKYTIGGTDYFVNSQGQIPLNDAGVHAASSKVGYMIDSEGKILTYSSGIQEINGEMYYVNSDGTFALNTTVQYLYFGSDGAYTTGNAELDDMVDAALAACITSSGLTQERKLRAAYIYVRDNFTYLSRAHQSRGSTSWTEESAVWMFTYKKGNCYCFAAAFMYMARRLGYQAYPISGGVGTANSDHAWVMIPWSNGVTYMFDVELDYAYRYRYNRGVTYDLYKFTTSTAPFKYYFP